MQHLLVCTRNALARRPDCSVRPHVDLHEAIALGSVLCGAGKGLLPRGSDASKLSQHPITLRIIPIYMR